MIQLMGISVSSARRYVAGTRATPNAVTARLHFLTFVLGQLAGAYDDVGIQRWFHRPRRFLNGNTPAQLLERDWQPDDDGPRQVQDVAATLGLRVGTERSGFAREAARTALERHDEAESEERHKVGYRKDPSTQREFGVPEDDHAWGGDPWREK